MNAKDKKLKIKKKSLFIFSGVANSPLRNSTDPTTVTATTVTVTDNMTNSVPKVR